MIMDGQPFVFGVPSEILPILGVPRWAQLRFRFRQDAEGLAFIRRGEGLECWTLDDYGDHWRLGTCRARNVRRYGMG